MLFNKYVFVTFIFVVVFLVISVLLRKEVETYAMYEANVKLDRILTNQKALHSYIENDLKPVIYKLKDEGKLYQKFFDAKILSFTYIARNVYEIENQIYKENKKPHLYYKLAANNPRNDLNKANAFEENIIKMFNENENIKEYKDIVEEEDKEFLYFAKPVTPNKKSCLKCHSDPKYAPQELIEKYGDVKGFHEKIGDIRAILSIKIPLDSELQYGNQYYTKLLVIIFIALLLVYTIIIYLLRNLDKKNNKLYEISTIDQLTNIYNRRVFDKDIHTSVIEVTRENKNLVLIMLDIDFFKKINDTYGHQVGDAILIKIAEIMQKSTREYDRVYRLGGEEFAIILKNIDMETSLLLAERIREEIQSHYAEDKNITASLGVCEYNKKDDVTLFYKKVDDALYMAKDTGRNRVVEYKES